MVTSQMTLQAIDNQTCRHYCLMFLKARAFAYSFHEFLTQWNKRNLVLNDSHQTFN